MADKRLVSFGYRVDLLGGSLSVWLDHFRWLAALAVTASHLRNGLFPDASSALKAWEKPFYFLTLFGTQAVVLFFVMSGLLVGGAIIRREAERRFSARDYAIDRAARLYSALIPALILTVAAQYLFALPGCRPDRLDVVFANALFLQNFAAEPLCNNHPLWSLSSEAWFYVIGPLVMLAAMRRSVRLTWWAVAALVPAVVWLRADYQTPLVGLAFWFAGLMPWFVRVRAGWLVGAVPLAGALLASRLHLAGPDGLASTLIAAGFAFLLCCTPPRPIGARLAKYAAGFSYSLYLVHVPIIYALSGTLGFQALPTGTLSSYVVYAVSLMGIVGTGALFGALFEARTPALRRILGGRGLRPERTAAAAE